MSPRQLVRGEAFNPFDSLFYELAYDQLAAKGTCFWTSRCMRSTPRPASRADLPVSADIRDAAGAESEAWLPDRLPVVSAGSSTSSLTWKRCGPPGSASARRTARTGERALISMFDLSDFPATPCWAHSVLNTASPPHFGRDPNCLTSRQRLGFTWRSATTIPSGSSATTPCGIRARPSSADCCPGPSCTIHRSTC